MTIEELKRVDLVELLSRTWNMSFKNEDGCFVALSPFCAERNPSFYVACAGDGHWVFCDHSDGSNGTIIDLMMRKFRTHDFDAACEQARQLVHEAAMSPSLVPVAGQASSETDWEWLYEQLQRNDATICRQYLVERGLDEELVDHLIADGVNVLNCVDASRYCCFAVRNAHGHLQSLFNRRIDGPSERDKFLLGRQYPFCMDWDRLAQANVIYVCEGIVDALSLLTLTPEACVVALPGTNCDFSGLPLPANTPLIEAFDADAAGRSAAAQLQKHFPKQTIQRFDLMGANDVNDYLQERKWMSEETEEVEKPCGNGKLSVKDRIAIALSDWPSRALARKYRVHHSRICDIRNEADTILNQAWADRHPGPKPKPVPSPDFQETKRELKKVTRELDMANMRKDWLMLQLDVHKQRDLEVERKQRRNKRKKKARRKLK